MSIEAFGEQRLAVCAMGVLMAVVYGTTAILGQRIRGRCATSGSVPARYATAALGLALALLVGFRIIPAATSYALLCLALTGIYAVDLLQDEHTRRRRVASLAPRAAIAAVPALWVAIAALSSLMLTPYFSFPDQRFAAIVVGVCVLAMAAIAWRIASAPVQLSGEDLQSERIEDRTSRLTRAGITAVLAIGIVFVFISFVNADLAVVAPIERIFNFVSLGMWLALWIWEMLYVRNISRSLCSP